MMIQQHKHFLHLPPKICQHKQFFPTVENMSTQTEEANIFPTNLYQKSQAAENLIPLNENHTFNNLLASRQNENFQNDINNDGYYDPDTEEFINYNNNFPLPDDGGDGAAAVVVSKIKTNPVIDDNIERQGWDVVNFPPPPPPRCTRCCCSS